MKFAYCHREFWYNFGIKDIMWTVGKNTKAIKAYIANKLKVGKKSEIRPAKFDPRDPFTGDK